MSKYAPTSAGLSTNTNFGAILVIALYLDGFLTGTLPF